jgi:hypothetical protein
MKLPADSAIARNKLTHYLLIRREEHDKSLFLSKAGYALKDAEQLELDIRRQLLPLDAEFLDRGGYGIKYIIRGKLKGPNGRVLRVVSIWMIENAGGSAKFVTLYPDKHEI